MSDKNSKERTGIRFDIFLHFLAPYLIIYTRKEVWLRIDPKIVFALSTRERKGAHMQKELSLYAILRKILCELNEQVVDHGDRVAFLYLKMAEYRGYPDDTHLENMMLACYTHDIGAYKTEKFLDLLKFDVSHPLEHCIYGYLFMKYFSPLGDAAEVLLHHHTPYSEKTDMFVPYQDEGILIHFLDRVDIFNVKHTDVDDLIWQVRNGAGRNFDPKDVEDFLRLQESVNVIESLRDGTYSVEVRNYFNQKACSHLLIKPIINMLAYEIDFKSEQTVIHTITTSILARILGEKRNLSSQEIENLEYAARLYDLGKIKIPTEILEKPGKLTAEEYHVIKKHVLYTDLIIGEQFPEEIVEIASRHHERLDGSGYPMGLTAEQLTVSDKILQVADVVSALLQRRSYKAAMDKKTVLAILQDQEGLGKLDSETVRIIKEEYDAIIPDVMEKAHDTICRYENLQEEYTYYLKKYSEHESEIIEEFGLFSSLVKR